MTRGHREYIIYQDGPFWKIRPWKGGAWMPESIKESFSSHGMAERALIAYLKKTDKFSKAIYPGCPEQARKSFTEHLSKVLLQRQAR